MPQRASKSQAPSDSEPAVPQTRWSRRPYQSVVISELPRRRFFVMLWRRQGGKSTILAESANFGMMRHPGLTVTYASASLLLGREIIYKESQVMAKAIAILAGQAKAADLKLETVDRETGKHPKLDPDDFAELFEAQRLEFRLWHDRTTFSRTQVIAPNPATARGWTGWVFLDEFGFIRDFRDLWEAVEPIVSTDPAFHLVMATTPPRDDAHYSYELTAPPIGATFPTDPNGNWYTSQAGVDVHRVDIHDAYAAGVKLYDLRTGKSLTPDEHFAQADDKDAWRRNYKVEHVLGGTAACGLIQLDTAQRRGAGSCACINCDSDADFDRTIEFLLSHIHPTNTVGLGWDLATTEKESSNPSAFAVVELFGVDLIVRLVVTWKTSDPAIALDRAQRLVWAVTQCRGEGPAVRPRKLCIDATNERYFAEQAKRELRASVPIDLVVGSQRVDRPGHEPTNWKQYLGARLVSELEDNHLTLPPERYLREDFRLVRKERGDFMCSPDAQGRHGDTFDAVKLGIEAATGRGGPTQCRTLPRAALKLRAFNRMQSP